MVKKTRRFGAQPVEDGAFEGSLHVATETYRRFFSELVYFHNYLNRRLLPEETEEVIMQGILTNMQNLLEHESEELIRHYAQQQGTVEDQQFQRRMDHGYVSFKSKCDWLRARSLIDQNEWEVMDEVRRLRNEYAHARPTPNRRRFRYRIFPLLTQRSLRKLFVDVELVLRKLRLSSGRASEWPTVPPGYASEMGWPAAYVEALDDKNKG